MSVKAVETKAPAPNTRDCAVIALRAALGCSLMCGEYTHCITLTLINTYPDVSPLLFNSKDDVQSNNAWVSEEKKTVIVLVGTVW